MMNPLGQYQEWASYVIGERLSGVKGVIYFFETPDLEHPQQLQLIFSNTEKAVSFRCGKDGSTLELTDSPVQENDLGEYGKEIIMDLSSSISFVDYIGKFLLTVYSIFSSVEDAYIGIKLVFEGGLNLIVVNIGDEINIFDSLSSCENDDIKYQEL
ncbi:MULTISPECIES: hypothetical protein [Pectobacterium]|uniref:hypothetical protein n=1 Tax=Pectobacterium TaxID=122277 RepID=UPI00196970DF|nr:hypothetical protein [Pectobacterium brasiliense]MBN3057636.1 hypothetical protein [Pectobacterium brasiliense]MBN7766447.1 hypothetical protein [Pectobacterium brasiliense]